jgi:hypothetical protein
MPGGTVSIQARGLPPNAALGLTFASLIDVIVVEKPLGTAATSDESGEAAFAVAIPTDAPLGFAAVIIRAGEQCIAEAAFDVIPSMEALSIDDRTVFPGQRVTLKASGFDVRSVVTLHIDGIPGDACECPVLASSRSNEVGAVEVAYRVPRNISRGLHFLTLSGESFTGTHDVHLQVRITVVGGGTLPATDTD